jgi:hypothetical protein
MKLLRVWLPMAVIGGFAPLHAQTTIDLRTQTKSVDFSSAAHTKPSQTGTALPAACSVGETYFNSAAPAGENLYGCTATNTWNLLGAGGTGGGGAGNVALTTGSGAPYSTCAAPSTTNVAVYIDTTNGDEWWCYAPNSWKKTLSVTGSGPYRVTGATGPAATTPASGYATCYFDATLNTQVCLDASGNASQMVKESTLAGMQKHSCDMAFGSTNAAAALANADLGPQVGICFVPAAATVLEIDARADAGTPAVMVGVDHGGTVSNLVSAALATASGGGRACAKATAAAGVDGTSCAGTLQNTGISAGDYIQAVSGTAGGTAKWMTVHVVYSVN